MPRISYQEASYFDGDLINLEINPGRTAEEPPRQPQFNNYHPYQIEIQDFKAFDYNMKLSPSSQS
jgi:hypothetical protein